MLQMRGKSLATPVGGAGINSNVCLIHSLLLRAKRQSGKRNLQLKKVQASQKSEALISKLLSVLLCCCCRCCCFFLSYSVGLQHPPQEKSLAFRSFLFCLFKCCWKIFSLLIRIDKASVYCLWLTFSSIPNRFQRKMQECTRLNWRTKEERTKLCWTWQMQVGATLSSRLIKILCL